MGRWGRLTTVGATLAAAAIAPLTGVTLTGTTPAQAAGSYQYVALGDSYSAASGNLPVDLSSPVCLRSTSNYPHVIASALGASLTDVTCGGAETKDFTTSQYPGVAPQLDAVTSSTNLVTMTIGGNDSNVFIGAIAACGALGVVSLGQGSPCKAAFGSSFDDTVNSTTYPALVAALDAVRAKAPHAKIAIIGYPEILPPTGGCFPQMPVASGDVPYLYDLEATLNAAIKRAAAATGATYVDMTAASTGHDACKPEGTRWIEPALFGQNPVIVHPNALGEDMMAQQTMAHLGLS